MRQRSPLQSFVLEPIAVAASRRFIAAMISGLSMLAFAGCSGSADVDTAGLVKHLQGKGYTVEIVGDVEQPFLNVKGKVLHARLLNVAGAEEMQSYDYPDEEAAKSDARQIAPDGSVRGSKMTWIAPPRFFQRGRLLVIYLGSNPDMLRALMDVLGPPFAGRTANTQL